MKTKMMSRIAIVAAVCGISLFTSCAKKSVSPSGGTGNGTFSVGINGKTVTGTAAIDNAVVIIVADPTAAFDTMGDIFVYMQSGGDSIGFHLPDRTGTTQVGNGSAATIYGVLTIPNADPFIFTSVTVNVTSLTKTRIHGTFSGGASTSLITGQGTTAQMTNGTFDLPIIP
jgi:hypothetical protein